MTANRILGNALLISAFTTLTACGGGSSSDFTAAPVAITIPFQAKSDTTEINCDADLLQLGITADNAKISSFAYYIHDVKLVTATGTIDFTLDANEFQDSENGVALLDYQDKNTFCAGDAKPTNKQITGTVSGDAELADVIGIDFKVGIPSEINHRDLSTNVSPYNIQSMFWNWNGGHKFMRLDINPTAKVNVTYGDNNTSATRNFHLGSTACEGEATTGEVVSCANENTVPVSLTGYSAANGQGASVVLDLAKLLAGSDINTDNGVKVGCMSFPNDPECAVMFNALGLGYGTTAATGVQTVFSIEKN